MRGAVHKANHGSYHQKKHHSEPSSQSGPHREDHQPNEAINKRQAGPAIIVSSKQHQAHVTFDTWRGFRGRGRGRGGRGKLTSISSTFLSHNTQPHARASTSKRGAEKNFQSSQASTDTLRSMLFTGGPTPPRPDPRLKSTRPSPPFIPHTVAAGRENRVHVPPLKPVRRDSHLDRPFVPEPESVSSNISSLFSLPLASGPQLPSPHGASFAPRTPPPAKRRRVQEREVEEAPTSLNSPRRSVQFKSEPGSLSPLRTPSPTNQVKSEPRSPSPPPSSSLPHRAVRSGLKRYFPIPPDCERQDVNYLENRRRWARREGSILKDLRLKVERVLFRDDGLVIEWSSEEDVWLDTLRPVNERAMEVIDLVDDNEDSDVVADVEPLATNSDSHPEPPADLIALTLEFVKRYISIFDHDRSAVGKLYARDAVFSFRNNNFAHPVHFTFRRKGLSQSRMPKLPVLERYRYSSTADGEVDVDYDIVLEGSNVVLTLYGELVDPDGRRLASEQAFVLMRTDSDSSEWPLVVVSHIMVIRDTPWVRWQGTIESLQHTY
ncbi:unnamed protein product [Mycena citricolor]|uniref:NTF2 domain-containing protein n=1 Tax=Mycena citricolor TaxID=2018698 RepID=A0AAD2K109_9AGAR|nr:unnamed protein product [Mycena citricolor]CAK5272982.1 unnamed protein product [Mycena citricolor]